jgi:hypothetical protein
MSGATATAFKIRCHGRAGHGRDIFRYQFVCSL